MTTKVPGARSRPTPAEARAWRAMTPHDREDYAAGDADAVYLFAELVRGYQDDTAARGGGSAGGQPPRRERPAND